MFDLFRKEKFAALQNESKKLEYKLRFEQNEAVEKAVEYFQNNEKGEFLLKVSRKLMGSKLTVSMIGYKNYE